MNSILSILLPTVYTILFFALGVKFCTTHYFKEEDKDSLDPYVNFVVRFVSGSFIFFPAGHFALVNYLQTGTIFLYGIIASLLFCLLTVFFKYSTHGNYLDIQRLHKLSEEAIEQWEEEHPGQPMIVQNYPSGIQIYRAEVV